MKSTEIVRRTLADNALAGRRNWVSLAQVAGESDCSSPNAFAATRHLLDIGALTKHPGGGLTVVDVMRTVDSVACTRSLSRDRLTSTSLYAATQMMSQVDVYAVGGSDAALHHLGTDNTIADHPRRILYLIQKDYISYADLLPDDDEVLIMPMDTVALRTWNRGFTSLTQTYSDLYALPGWQASEFRHALHTHLTALAHGEGQAHADLG